MDEVEVVMLQACYWIRVYRDRDVRDGRQPIAIRLSDKLVLSAKVSRILFLPNTYISA